MNTTIVIVSLLALWILWIFLYYSFVFVRPDQEGMNSKSPTVFSTTTGGTAKGDIKYDSNSYNTEYHDTIDVIMESNDGSDISFNSFYALDACGNPVLITKTANQANSTYNVPGTYVYGPSSYVPKYEDSVFFSKMTPYSQLYNTAAMQAGFCTQYANSPADIERVCNATDLNNCASTSCCVLLGGSKCVAGNENGPTLKTNYSDQFIQDPTYYFFQGNCYGNCASGV